ncbi:hypothetical protein SB773_25975 [Bacillus sp. SIMBA_074]|uniref:hypothetical protein n=1 Tax=Bacillus sp. SIMBA_074 TaxID=3085812 RepID=UPI00397AC5BF
MDEQKKLRNTLDIEVNVDTDEAHEKIKELTEATNECVEAFERLEKKLEKFTSSHVQIDGKNLINDDVIKVAKRNLGIEDYKY